MMNIRHIIVPCVPQVLLQLSQWLPQGSYNDYPDISDLVEDPLSIIITTLQASVGSIKQLSITSHLTPLLNNSLYVLAHMWKVEGRVTPKFRKQKGPTLLKVCLDIMVLVAEGEQVGRHVDGPPTSHEMWGVSDFASAPSVAVDVLCALHVLVEDEHFITNGEGEDWIVDHIQARLQETAFEQFLLHACSLVSVPQTSVTNIVDYSSSNMKILMLMFL